MGERVIVPVLSTDALQDLFAVSPRLCSVDLFVFLCGKNFFMTQKKEKILFRSFVFSLFEKKLSENTLMYKIIKK